MHSLWDSAPRMSSKLFKSKSTFPSDWLLLAGCNRKAGWSSLARFSRSTSHAGPPENDRPLTRTGRASYSHLMESESEKLTAR